MTKRRLEGKKVDDMVREQVTERVRDTCPMERCSDFLPTGSFIELFALSCSQTLLDG
jgi:hypothetical protein